MGTTNHDPSEMDPRDSHHKDESQKELTFEIEEY
jgi:hypothetical protein